MMRRVAVAALAFSLTLSGARPALAHGFGPTYDIPIPLWLYLYGAAAAVVLSFLPLALFSRKERYSPYEYPRFDLFRVRLLRTLLTSRLLTGGLRLLSVALFLVVVIAGLVGLQSGFNFAPTFVWVTWWVGLQPLYRFRREPVAARESLEGSLRSGRRAGPPARLQGRARAGRALSGSTRHLASCGTLPGIRLDRERLLGFVRAAQHRPLRPRLHPDHTLRHGLLRQGDLAAPGEMRSRSSSACSAGSRPRKSG